MKYKVIDKTEYGKIVLGFVGTMRRVERLAMDRIRETGGHCAIYYAVLQPTGKYSPAIYWECV